MTSATTKDLPSSLHRMMGRQLSADKMSKSFVRNSGTCPSDSSPAASHLDSRSMVTASVELTSLREGCGYSQSACEHTGPDLLVQLYSQ